MIRHPFGEATFRTVPSAATINLEVTNALEHVTIALTGNATVNVTASADLPAGSMLFIRAASDGTARNITPGTGLVGPAIAGVISKTKVAQYLYNGTAFVACAAEVQID